MTPSSHLAVSIVVLLLASVGATALAEPRVVETIPTGGATNVDPALPRVVVTFSEPMRSDSFSIVQARGGQMPEPVGDTPFTFRDATTFVMSVKLAPDTAYAFALNSPTRKGFVSAGGEPLPPTVIRFRTASAGKAEPTQKRTVRWGMDDDASYQPPKRESVSLTRDPQENKTQTRRPEPTPDLPQGWLFMDDKLFGSRVAVPPGWSPRVRGDVALCVEPDALAGAGVFFVPLLLKGQTRPDALADGFDEMLRRALPDLRTQTTGKPTTESVQRDMTATIRNQTCAGGYRAVVSRSGTGFVMGYVAPTDALEQLRPVFYRILGSYRYTGSRMRLVPFKSAAVELRIPQGWQVWTSEGKSPSQDIDWQVSCPQVPGARAFMVSPKYFTPNWVSNMATGQPDPHGLMIWQGKGFQMATFASDEQALAASLNAALPGLQIVRQQPMPEVRELLNRVFGFAMQTVASTGGRMTWHVYEVIGRREVQGVELKSMFTLGLCSMLTPGGIKGTLGMWQAQVRGIEAPAEHFAQLAPTLDRVCSSFSYTLWWIKTVQKANEHQAQAIRKFWAQSNQIDKEIFDNRMKTQGAIAEMMYDNLTENNGYVNKQTGTIEKVPTEHLERFRREDGEIVSPEEVIDKQIPVEQAKPLRQAWADDYMKFDRRVQVWP